jgi:hypothetical protein
MVTLRGRQADTLPICGVRQVDSKPNFGGPPRMVQITGGPTTGLNGLDKIPYGFWASGPTLLVRRQVDSFMAFSCFAPQVALLAIPQAEDASFGPQNIERHPKPAGRYDGSHQATREANLGHAGWIGRFGRIDQSTYPDRFWIAREVEQTIVPVAAVVDEVWQPSGDEPSHFANDPIGQKLA